ncbi:MAG: SPFH domain-containing protein [Chitinophagales bacterium]
MSELIIIVVIVVVGFVTFTAILGRYKRCPSDKILVIYGLTGRKATGEASSARCVHGGAAFIWPVFQSYAYLDLKPISIEANLTNALSKQNIRVDVPCRFTVGITTDPENMNNAAERLLGLSMEQVHELAKDILFGQLRLVIATMDIEEINTDRDKFLAAVSQNVEAELRKVGLKLINVNVTDIRDESGYIEALGKEAAAKAINEAKKSVAEQERFGEIGKAEAERDKDIRIAETQRDRDSQIASAMKDKEILIANAHRDENIGKADADRDTRIRIAEANATAVKGENVSKINVANSDSERREREAEALRKATAAEKVQTAKALEEAYVAEKLAEEARAERERMTQKANVIVQAEIQKEKAVIDAEAEAEMLRRTAKGEADAQYAKMEAQARGLLEILSKQADGLERIVKAAGGDANKAAMLLITDKLPELMRTQVDAIKNIKIDKITVWDGNGANGTTNTAHFISNMMKSVPPLNELFKMAGMDLPDYLGTETGKKTVELKDDKKKSDDTKKTDTDSSK